MPDTNGTATLTKATPRADLRLTKKRRLMGDKIVKRRWQASVEKADGTMRRPLLSGKDLPILYREGFTRLVWTTYDMPSERVVREVTKCLACGGLTYGD